MNHKSQGTLFHRENENASITPTDRRKMREPIPRLDTNSEIRERLLKYCRLKPGEIWEDSVSGHRVGVLDATNSSDVTKICGKDTPRLVVNDPPYNILLANRQSDGLGRKELADYLEFSKRWVNAIRGVVHDDSHLYIWIGADVKNGFQPFPDFMIMMREYPEFVARNLVTVRNQRGYGTQKNWMWVRQELLHYIKGNPSFQVVYTDIPKILRGYYKEISGARTENLDRSKSDTIRPGNVWVDIQQVFYRLSENVPGAYAQKPLKAIERIVQTSSNESDVVLDCFAHSGTTLIAGERLNRRVFTFDNDPLFAEITIRRLERLRETKQTGWQCGNPFPETE